MTVVVIIFLPLVLAYQAWTYYVFRRRVSVQSFRPAPPAPPTPPAPRQPEMAAVPSQRAVPPAADGNGRRHRRGWLARARRGRNG
jgi:hypothetical protein